jgi:TIR domain
VLRSASGPARCSMADIFLSYRRADRDRVVPLVALFEARGWTVWSETRIDAGEQWDEVIEREVDAASCVVAVWSHQSVTSRWVRAEAGEGLERGILVPVLIDSAKPPLEFRRVHAIDLTAWRGGAGERLAQMLLGAVARVFERNLAEAGRSSATAQADPKGCDREVWDRGGRGLMETPLEWARSAACQGVRLASGAGTGLVRLARRTRQAKGAAVLLPVLVAAILAGATVLRSKAWQAGEASPEVADPQRADVVLALSQLHIGNGEIIRARELLAANKSLAPGRIVLALGETYDPNVRAPVKDGGVPADAARAMSLYLNALALGLQTPKKRIDDLSVTLAIADRTLARGKKLLEEGQVAPARGCFLYVYQKGLAAGAFMMATTFDPQEMKQPWALGIRPDPEQARLWYERARELRHPQADERLQRLAARP